MPIKTQTYSSLADKASKRLIHSVNEWCMGKYSQNYVCKKGEVITFQHLAAASIIRECHFL